MTNRTCDILISDTRAVKERERERVKINKVNHLLSSSADDRNFAVKNKLLSNNEDNLGMRGGTD